MKKILAATLILFTTNVNSAPSELIQADSLLSAVIQLQKINYKGPTAESSNKINTHLSNNINSLGKAALAKHAENTESMVRNAKLNEKPKDNPDDYFTSLFPAALAKHYKTAPPSTN